MIGPFDNPLLGALFGDTQATEIWGADRQLAHMLAFEAAYTHALGKVGMIECSAADAVAKKIKEFKPDMDDLRTATERDGVMVPALVAQLKRNIPHQSRSIHTGATSQDVIDTALAMTLRDFNRLFEDRMSDLMTKFGDLGERFGDKTIMGRTRMQAAIPIKFVDRLSAWQQPLAAHRTRLNNMRKSVEILQLGGGVGDRAALKPDVEAITRSMATELELNNPPKVWHSTRDGVVDYAGLLSLVSGSLGKFGQDVCLMAQQGIDEVTMSGGGGSSAMPHKQNPVLAELLISLARFNATQISGMQHSLIHEQERSGAAWMLEWMILPQMAQATARSLSVAGKICESITRLGSPI